MSGFIKELLFLGFAKRPLNPETRREDEDFGAGGHYTCGGEECKGEGEWCLGFAGAKVQLCESLRGRIDIYYGDSSWLLVKKILPVPGVDREYQRIEKVGADFSTQGVAREQPQLVARV